MSKDVDLFVSSCIHCLSTTEGGNLSRPIVPALFGTKPNDLIQFDYIILGSSRTGPKYVLMVCDNHRGYAWFYPASNTDSETTPNVSLDWRATVGVPQGLMSYGSSHFNNESLRLRAKGPQSTHHFTLPYCPWANGSIKRLGKKLFCVARVFLSEHQMRHDDWPQLVSLFQSALKNAPSPQPRNIAPITAFTGRPASHHVTTSLRSSDCHPISVTAAQLEAAGNVSSLVQYMESLHALVHNHLQKKRERIREV